MHLVAVADIRDHRAAPLGHTVDLADLHVVALLHKSGAQQLGGKQRPLPADAHNQNVFH